jgi:hypothetical protein
MLEPYVILDNPYLSCIIHSKLIPDKKEVDHMNTLMIIITVAFSQYNARPVSVGVSQTTTLVSAATCTKAKEVLSSQDYGRDESFARVFVRCVPVQ